MISWKQKTKLLFNFSWIVVSSSHNLLHDNYKQCLKCCWPISVLSMTITYSKAIMKKKNVFKMALQDCSFILNLTSFFLFGIIFCLLLLLFWKCIKLQSSLESARIKINVIWSVVFHLRLKLEGWLCHMILPHQI